MTDHKEEHEAALMRAGHQIEQLQKRVAELEQREHDPALLDQIETLRAERKDNRRRIAELERDLEHAMQDDRSEFERMFIEGKASGQAEERERLLQRVRIMPSFAVPIAPTPNARLLQRVRIALWKSDVIRALEDE